MHARLLWSSVVRLPIPACLFIKVGVTRHMHAPIHQIVGVVALDALVVADEDHGEATIVELAKLQTGGLDVDHTPECPQMLHNRLPSVPCLERCHAVQALGGTTIPQVHRTIQPLPPQSGSAAPQSRSVTGCTAIVIRTEPMVQPVKDRTRSSRSFVQSNR